MAIYGWFWFVKATDRIPLLFLFLASKIDSPISPDYFRLCWTQILFPDDQF